MCQATYFELCKQQTSNTPKEEEDDEEEEKKNTHKYHGIWMWNPPHFAYCNIYTLNVSACHYAFNNKDSSFSVH